MTRYTVTWREGAQKHLAQIWMDTDDPPFTVSEPDRLVEVVSVRADRPSPQKNGQPRP